MAFSLASALGVQLVICCPLPLITTGVPLSELFFAFKHESRVPVLSTSPDTEFISHAWKIDPWPINILTFEIIHSLFLNLKG